MTRQKPSRKSVIFLVIAGIFVLFYEFFLFYHANATTKQLQKTSSVHFIDVGQGDSSLILVNGQAILIDGGITQMGSTVTDYLKEQHVTQLSAVIATHPHEDHIGGLSTVLAEIPTQTLYLPSQSALTQSYQSLLDTAAQTHVRVEVPQPGQVLSLGKDATLEFLSPMPDASFENANLASIVCLLKVQGQRILFTGDIEKEIESQLVQQNVLPPCDVLKVAHHGSDTSSTLPFLQAVTPKIAVISCAKYNDYGHPSPTVLERFASLGTQVHITAQQGTYIYSLPNLQEGEQNT